MVAAIFPVAIQQGKVTNDETIAASAGRDALSIVGQIANNSDSGVAYNVVSSSYVNAYPTNGGGPLFPATGTAQQGPAAMPTLPAMTTGNVWSFRDPNIGTFSQLNGNGGTLGISSGRPYDYVWQKISQSLILPTDPRYAFVGLYRRDGDPNTRSTWSPFAQVWFIPVTSRTRSVYDATKDAVSPATATPSTTVNLAARVVQVEITDPAGTFSTSPVGGYVIRNYTNNAAAGYSPSSIVTGCYVIIARDNINAPTQVLVGFTNPVPLEAGRMNGHIYHVGIRRPDLDGTNYQTFELAPNGDFAPDAGVDHIFSTSNNSTDDILAIGNITTVGTTGSMVTASAPADAYVIGTDIIGEPGTAQDVSAFSTFVKVN